MKKIYFYLLLGICLIPMARSEAEEKPAAEKKVLDSPLAGRWYPGREKELKTMLGGFFKQADTAEIKHPIAMILPHAGYRWSGPVAAAGLKGIKRQFKRIIVIGPSHQVYLRDAYSIPPVTHYRTPLGEVKLDREFIAKLLQHKVFKQVARAHQAEHSVQIEIPLLQFTQSDFKLVPIVAGQCRLAVIQQAAEIISSELDEQTLVIASSDFTHYGGRFSYEPFKNDIPVNLKKLDYGSVDFIKQKDAAGFLQYKARTGITICGDIPIATLLTMLPKEAKAEVIAYQTSGALENNYANSVSYFAIAFSGEWSDKLTDSDRKELLQLARKTIIYYLAKRKKPKPEELGVKISENMKKNRAAFVTLHKKGQLRGCIGEIFPRHKLYETVIERAISAAVDDPRFSSVKASELKDIDIEISALTPPKEVASWKDIRIGVDGVVLSKGGRRAVFLPQVAPQQGWTLEETLTHLARKAWLPEDAWKKDATFLTFQAEVFGEKPH